MSTPQDEMRAEFEVDPAHLKIIAASSSDTAKSNALIHAARALDAQAEALAAVTRERDALLDSSKRLRYALGDPNGEMTAPQLTRRAHELRQKAAKWDDWHDAQGRIETEMPEGWAFVMQCSPGDWDLYLTNPDGERVKFDRDCDTTAQVMGSAIDAARATLTPTAPGAQEQA